MKNLKLSYKLFWGCLLFLVAGCEIGSIWRNDLVGFVEDGVSVLQVRADAVDFPGLQQGHLPSGTDAVLYVPIINPRNLRAEYSVSINSADAWMYDEPPRLEAKSRDSVSISFTPSLAAERNDLSFILSLSAPDINREYESHQFVVSCNTRPGPAHEVEAFFDHDFLRHGVQFRLPNGPTDDDLSRVEVKYKLLDSDQNAEIKVFNKLQDEYTFFPSDQNSDDRFSYQITIFDTAGLKSDPVSINNPALGSYYVFFDANGGENPPQRQLIEIGESFTIPFQENMKKDGQAFANWKIDGADHYPDQSFTMPEAHVTLVAQWQEGQEYQPGQKIDGEGWVFYDKGYYSEGWRFMLAALEEVDEKKLWQTDTTGTGGTSEDIGTGYENTYNALSDNHPAAEACKSATYGGHEDWFLPSKDELAQMFDNLPSVFPWSSPAHWSSSEVSASSAYCQNHMGGIRGLNKASPLEVRAARRF